MASSSSSFWRLVAAVALVAWFALGVSAARAGTYDVGACDAAGGINNSWVPWVNDGNAVAAYVSCPSGGDPSRGMIARNVNVNAASGAGPLAKVTFQAPADTSIVAINASYDFSRNSSHWEAALSTGSQILLGCGAGGVDACSTSGIGQWIDVPHAGQLYIDVSCVTASCDLNGGAANARLYSAVVRLEDDTPPAITSVGGSLWSSGWKSGTQAVDLAASDNTGIRLTAVAIDGNRFASNGGACDGTLTIPCPQASDSYPVNTAAIGDGAHDVTVSAVDSAGNPTSVSQRVSIDNTPPAAPTDLTVTGGEDWHATNSFDVTWTDPAADGGAPISGADWQICPASGTTQCVTGSKNGDGLRSLQGLNVPGDGDWILHVWLHDQAGNGDERTAAPPVHLRLDGEAPHVVFSPALAADPTRLVVQASDGVSGIASGEIDIKSQGTDTWTVLPTQLQGGRLTASIPDEQLPDGAYDLRALAADHAGNERSTNALADGTPMQVTLPVRAPTVLTGGHAATVRRHGRRVKVLRQSLSIGYSSHVTLQGQLTDAQGHPMAGVPLTVSVQTALPGAPWITSATITTSRTGRYSLRAGRHGTSRTIRVRYEGTALIRPSSADVRLRVASSSTIRASRHRVRHGQAVRFSGTLRGGHVPTGGKLVELQVLVRRRWQVFATTHTTAKGAWKRSYRFSGNYAAATYVFRAHVPPDPSYPFTTGHSPSTKVLVRRP